MDQPSPHKFWCCFDFYNEDFQLESIFTNESDAKKWQQDNPHATGATDSSHRWILNFSLSQIKEYFKQTMLSDLAKLESITINVVNKSVQSSEEFPKVLRGHHGLPVAVAANQEKLANEQHLNARLGTWITINGENVYFSDDLTPSGNRISYEWLVKSAFPESPQNLNYTVTWHSKEGGFSGSLVSGKSIIPSEDGIVFNVANTGNA